MTILAEAKRWFWSLQINHGRAAIVYAVAAVLAAWQHSLVMVVVFAVCGSSEFRQALDRKATR